MRSEEGARVCVATEREKRRAVVPRGRPSASWKVGLKFFERVARLSGGRFEPGG